MSIRTTLMIALVAASLSGPLAAEDDDRDSMTPDRIERVLHWVREHHPDWFEELLAWKERGERERFVEKIREFEREMGEGEERERPDREEGKDHHPDFPAERVERAIHWAVERGQERLVDEIHSLAERGAREELVRLVERIEVEMRAAENRAKEERDLHEDRHESRPDHPDEADHEARERAQLAERLELRTKELAERARGVDGEDREKFVGELREVLAQHFELREWFRHREVERLERELAEMREALEHRHENREGIIEKRLRQLLGKGDDLDW